MRSHNTHTEKSTRKAWPLAKASHAAKFIILDVKDIFRAPARIWENALRFGPRHSHLPLSSPAKLEWEPLNTGALGFPLHSALGHLRVSLVCESVSFETLLAVAGEEEEAAVVVVLLLLYY